MPDREIINDIVSQLNSNLIEFVLISSLALIFIGSFYIVLTLINRENIQLDEKTNEATHKVLFWGSFSFIFSILLFTIATKKYIVTNNFYWTYFFLISLSGAYTYRKYLDLDDLLKSNSNQSIEKIRSRIKNTVIIFLVGAAFFYIVSLLYYFYLVINTPLENPDFSFGNIINIILAAGTLFYAAIAYYSLKDNRKTIQKQTVNSQKQLDYIELSQLENTIQRLKDTQSLLIKTSNCLSLTRRHIGWLEFEDYDFNLRKESLLELKKDYKKIKKCRDKILNSMEIDYRKKINDEIEDIVKDLEIIKGGTQPGDIRSRQDDIDNVLKELNSILNPIEMKILMYSQKKEQLEKKYYNLPSDLKIEINKTDCQELIKR